jgi:outer membrane protein assembly factor BamB
MNREYSTPRKPLRLWPGVVIVTVQWLAMFGLPLVAPEQGGTALLGGFIGAMAVGLWWLFFSRAAWLERLGALVAAAAALAATSRLVHESISNGMMGFMLFIYALPLLSLALVAWTAASRGVSGVRRYATMVAAILAACGTLTLVRTNGITGDAGSDFEWRWTPTAEQQLLARGGEEPLGATQGGPAAASPAPAGPAAVERVSPARPAGTPSPAPIPPDAPTARVRPAASGDEAAPVAAVLPAAPRAAWPGFRGPTRDSVVRGARVETDWSRTPPVEVWRRPIGPGWSSFAVAGDRVFTQEQRGEDEVVSAYSLETGEPVWRHRDAARFWESNAGAGPRATPTFHNGRVYTLGGTGILNALDARDGSVIWSRNAVSDTRATIPDWGIASSPLIVGDIVIAAAAGSLAAYDLATGKPRWFGPGGGWGYSSPHLSTVGGVEQVVLVNGPGAIGVAPSDGTVLWQHTWAGDGILQPAMLEGGGLLIASGSGLASHTGTLRVAVGRGSAGWTVDERWTTNGFKPYFNDFVVHEGHAFGFDGSILACIDLEDGQRKWKGGRYGHGQMLLLPDQDLLLVLSEEGELALVRAAPDQFTELARVAAIEGKTWNHPVLVGDLLLVRNGEEMAAFRLPLESRGSE